MLRGKLAMHRGILAMHPRFLIYDGEDDRKSLSLSVTLGVFSLGDVLPMVND